MIKDKIILAAQKEPNTAISTLYWRMRRYGTPFKKQDGREKHFIEGRRAVDVARENGIPDTLFRARLRNGWTPWFAATRPARAYKRKANE